QIMQCPAPVSPAEFFSYISKLNQPGDRRLFAAPSVIGLACGCNGLHLRSGGITMAERAFGAFAGMFQTGAGFGVTPGVGFAIHGGNPGSPCDAGVLERHSGTRLLCLDHFPAVPRRVPE